MKKNIAIRLCIVIIVSMFVAAFLSYILQIKSAKSAMHNNFMLRIDQIEQILENNDADIEKLKENLQEDYFIRAKAAAYIIQNHPEVIDDLEEIRKIAALLQVDELHLFDTEGTLFAGSEPKYYNYTFESGEQMQFFLPMLDDYSLQLCQDITPNTAESKLMQYIAVWREDHQGIVQIGMEPVRLLEAMEKNELSHIFTIMTTDQGVTIFAADPESGEILGATNDDLLGQNVALLGIGSGDLAGVPIEEGEEIDIVLEGEKNYCVLRRVGHVLVGVSSTYQRMYQNLPGIMVLVIFSLTVLSVVIIILILRMLDRYIIHGIYEMMEGMKRIAGGDLDTHIQVDNSPEFIQLSSSINHMVESLLETTGKLSLVFQNVNIPIAVYEYNMDMRRVQATSRFGDILMLSEEQQREALEDRDAFIRLIQSICDRPFPEEKDVYVLKGEEGLRYVRIKSYKEEQSVLGIVVDMSEEIAEKQKITRERDVDLLTELLSRRAFFSEMDRLFSHPETLKTAVLLMADLDNLKYVNDNWGHEYGDLLLKTAAGVLAGCQAPGKVAGRLSGDEFVLLLYGAETKEELRGYLDQLYHNLQETYIQMPNQEMVPVRLSGGYIFYPDDSQDYAEMLRLADQTMYLVKRGDKGYFEEYHCAKRG